MLELIYHSFANIKHPDFSVTRVQTNITAFNGHYNLTGCFTPQGSEGEEDGGQRVLLFVKVDVVR